MEFSLAGVPPLVLGQITFLYSPPFNTRPGRWGKTAIWNMYNKRRVPPSSIQSNQLPDATPPSTPTLPSDRAIPAGLPLRRAMPEEHHCLIGWPMTWVRDMKVLVLTRWSNAICCSQPIVFSNLTLNVWMEGMSLNLFPNKHPPPQISKPRGGLTFCTKNSAV